MQNTKKFDREEWLGKLKGRIDSERVVEVQLRPSGASASEIQRFLGKNYAHEAVEGNKYRFAVKVK